MSADQPERVNSLPSEAEAETPLIHERGDNRLDNATVLAHQQAVTELRHMQTRLQRLRAEYETTVEELRTANEELQATNEEYKATLDELAASQEALQLINQELKHKISEVTEAHGDLQNFLAATEIATLFLDRELRIKRYTPRAAEFFPLLPSDRGRPIAQLRAHFRYDELAHDARQVLTHLAPLAREVQSQDERWFLMQIRPYRTVEDRSDGVVITFVDITTNKANELALQNAKEFAESIVHTIPDALLVLTPALHVQMANDAFYTMFAVNPAATEGQLIYELGNGQWNIPALRTLLEEILPENKVFFGYEVDHRFEAIGRRTMLLNGRQLDHVQLILLAITDITDRKRNEINLAFLAQLGDDFALLTTADEIMASAGEKLAHHLGLSRCNFSVVDEAADRITTIYDWRRSETAPSVLGAHAISTFRTDAARKRYAAGLLTVVDDVYTDPQLAAPPTLMDTLQIRAVVDVPYLEHGRWQFLLSACRAEPTHWRDDEVELIRELAARVYLRLERARAEAAVREAATRLRIATEAGELATWEWQLASDEVYWNDQHFLILGLTPAPGPVAPDFFFRHVYPADREWLSAALATAIAEQGLFEAEFRVVRTDGKLRWMRGYGRVTAVAADAVTKMSGVMFDITERKATEARITADLEATRILRDLSAQLIAEGDAQVLYMEILAAAIQLTQADGGMIHTLAEAGQNLALLAAQGFDQALIDHFQRVDRTAHPPCSIALATGERSYVTFKPAQDDAATAQRLLRAAGYLAAQSTPLVTRGGKLIGMLSTYWRTAYAPVARDLYFFDLLARQAADLIERRQAEAALQQLNATLEQQVDTRTVQARALASELALAEQEERRRISQILHDDLQQLLYGMQMRMLTIISDVAANDITLVQQQAQEVYTWLGDAIQTTRQLTVDLSPPVLKGEGLADALEWLANQMARVNGLQVKLQVGATCTLPNEDMRVLLFQIVRELLFNVVKHAQTDEATVVLQTGAVGECVIRVQDDGCGFDVETAAHQQGGGFGLFSVRERLNLFGGRMEIDSAPGQGTHITIYAPLETSGGVG